MNPAVTLAFAVVRRLDWIKVPAYWLAQLLGTFIASAIVYGIYYGRFEMWAWSSIVSLLPPTSAPHKHSITLSFGEYPVDNSSPSSLFISQDGWQRQIVNKIRLFWTNYIPMIWRPLKRQNVIAQTFRLIFFLCVFLSVEARGNSFCGKKLFLKTTKHLKQNCYVLRKQGNVKGNHVPVVIW